MSRKINGQKEWSVVAVIAVAERIAKGLDTLEVVRAVNPELAIAVERLWSQQAAAGMNVDRGPAISSGLIYPVKKAKIWD